MPDPADDFATFLGPDKRWPPRIGWQPAVVLGIAVFVILGMAVLIPKEKPDVDLSLLGLASDAIPASVSSSSSAACSYAPDLTCFQVAFDFTYEGADQQHVQEFPDDGVRPDLEVGQATYVYANEFEDGTISFQYADRDRRGLLGLVALFFALAVVALGRSRGLYALLGLTASVVVLWLFIIPAIIGGRDAVLVALVGGGAIMLISLYLTHGAGPLTHISAIGAFGALALTTLLSWLVVGFARFTGFATEESFYVSAVPGLDMGGLLLAGIVLGALGALDDVTVTQASAVWEVSTANPDIDSRGLFESGLRVGRDHIASTVNTLLLAYVGAALPLLILYSLSDLSLGFVVSNEVVAIEVVRTLVGSVGLVAAVPLTTWLAASSAGRRVSGSRTPLPGDL